MILHNLRKQKAEGYTTFGCMWDRGECQKDTAYSCRNKEGQKVPMQSRITAYWPDGSVKWTAHTANSSLFGEEIEVLPAESREAEEDAREKEKAEGICIEETEDIIVLDNGVLSLKIPRRGEELVEEITRTGQVVAEHVRPQLLLEEPITLEGCQGRVTRPYQGRIAEVVLEEQGSLFCIVKYTGIHKNDREEKLPFIIRMKVGYGESDLSFTHTFLYDGDEEKDYLKGLGISFEMPMEGELYHRHIKVTGDHGVFHECVVPLVAWRPMISKEIYVRQMAGERLVLSEEEKAAVSQILQATPYWSEYRIAQTSVNHFSIQKKLAGEHLCAIDCLNGSRSEGGVYVGSEAGGVMLGIRDFWEKYPSGYTIKGLDTEKMQCSLWFWSPEAPAMDFRHYADRGYNQVCYEGYDYKGATPVGIACTNECSISFREEMAAADEELLAFTEKIKHPVVYVGTPEFYHEKKAFGYWSLPCKGETEMEAWLEEQLERAFSFYKQEVAQRSWYGMFNYGDFMHTYDSVRHQWRYDMGGYAWDNTELVPTLWLWMYFMRTGREDVFELAEKLSRHTSEVDVYHLGKYKGLGSRHNVRHWGCPCKEARIAMAGHHRFYYYLTGDRRLEDIFDELKDNEMSFLNKDPLGDFYDKKDMVYKSHARSGPDWSSLCSNWMTQWERFDDTRYRDKILVGIEDLKKAPLRLVSGPQFEFDPATCHLRYFEENTEGSCHLQLCMGAPEIWTELADWLEDDEWKEMLADLGQFYYLPIEEQIKKSGGLIGNRRFSFPFMASGIAAYSAYYRKDKELARTTWANLLHTLIDGKKHDHVGFASKVLTDCGNTEALTEISWVTTNFVAQFCLNAIVALDYIKEQLPATMEEMEALVAELDPKDFHSA